MDFELLASGFATVLLNPMNFLLIVIGVTSGIFIGALPGLTATMGVALLVPFTFGLPPIQGLVMLLGIFSGGIYGGSISGILIGIPGTPAAAATLLDGHPLAKQGKAGKTIGMATVSSFVGGITGALIMTFLSPQIARFGLRFGPAEFFSLAVFGLMMIISISGKSLIKGVIAALIGLLMTTVGFDPISGVPRFWFGNQDLMGGITFIPALIGLFGFSQVFRNVEKMRTSEHIKSELGNVLPTLQEIGSSGVTMLKSGLIGTFVGSVPGCGCDIAAFMAYGEAKRSSKNPERFGKGEIKGVAAAEAANNGATGGAMIPMLTLGVPGDAVTAVLLGALTIHGFQPGPLLFRDHLDIVYPIFAGMIAVQVVMLIVGLSGARLFSKLINIDPKVLTPIIFFLCIVGSYSIRFSFFDVGMALSIGILAYFMEYFLFPTSPILLALILGPMAEQNIRRALMLSDGDVSVFFTRPISVAFLALAVLTAASTIYRNGKTRKKELANVQQAEPDPETKIN